MSEYLERTDAINPTFGDYVTLEMKCYGGPNEHFVHEVLSSPFISNSWRNVPIDARDPEEHLHDTSETVVAVRAQGVNPRDAHIFAVRLPDVLPMKGDKWAWQESPLRARIAKLEAELKITDELLKEATETIGAVVACCTYNSNDDAKIGIYGIDQKAFTRIDQFITHYNDAVSAGKVSVDVKRDLSDAEIEELGAQEAERKTFCPNCEVTNE